MSAKRMALSAVAFVCGLDQMAAELDGIVEAIVKKAIEAH